MFSEAFLERARANEQEWRKSFEETAKRFQAESYQKTTNSGIPVKPVYFPQDAADLEDPAAPGQYPFTRGLYAAQYHFMNWANQPVIGYGTPEDTRKRMDYLTSQGMTGYFGNTFFNLVYDLVSHEGLDPDHPAAKGRIGQCGMAVYSRRDMETLFEGLPLDKINVVHITMNETLPAFAHYLAYAQKRGVPWAKLRGNTMNWYYSMAYCGESTFPPDSSFKLAVELIEFCSKNMPAWNTTNFFGYGMEEAGATAVQEVGFTVAAGVAYAEACVARGLKPDDFLPRFGFQIAQANDFFEEIAKVRALRRLWAKVMHERFGANDPRSLHVRIHTHTSGASLTSQQPLNNLIRTTLHTLGAALAGVQSMEVCAWDEALAIPTEESAALSLRVQQIIQEETNITNVGDPLGGSYYLESLTNEIEKRAAEILAEVDRRGGYKSCWETGYIRREIERSAYEWREAVDQGERVIVGVNKYVTEEKGQEVPVFEVDPEVEKNVIKRLQDLRARRDPATLTKALEGVRQAAQKVFDGQSDGGLIPAMVEASSKDATSGELTDVLREVFGWQSSY